MTIDAHLSLTSEDVLDFGWLGRLWRTVVRAVQRASLTASEQSLLDHVEAGSTLLGQPLLHANDRDDLTRQIDLLMHEPRIGEWIAELARLAAKIDGEALADLAPPREALVDALGEAVLRRADEAMGMLLEIGAAAAESRSWFSPEEREYLATQIPKTSYDVAHHPAAPEGARTAMLGDLRFSLCALALASIALSRRPREGWLKLALADELTAGVRALRDWMVPDIERFASPVVLTERGRAAVLRVLDTFVSKTTWDSERLASLRERLEATEPDEPLDPAGLRPLFDQVLSAAEDLVDNEDADAALHDDRIAWDDVKAAHS